MAYRNAGKRNDEAGSHITLESAVAMHRKWLALTMALFSPAGPGRAAIRNSSNLPDSHGVDHRARPQGHSDDTKRRASCCPTYVHPFDMSNFVWTYRCRIGRQPGRVGWY